MTLARRGPPPRRPAGPVRAVRLPRPQVAAGVPLDTAIVVLTAATILAVTMISPELLTALKIHYISSGGGFYEKLHPATFLACLAFLLMVLRGSAPVRTIDFVISDAKLLLFYFFTCAMVAFESVVLKRPFTTVFDTFILPALICLLVWNLTDAQRRPLVYTLHFAIWVNIVLGYYEYISKHRLVPITVGKLVVTGDWRSTALLGHPLSAAGVVAVYIMALALARRERPPSPLGVGFLLVAVSSLLVFGGRTALVAVMVVLAGIAAVNAFRLLRGDSFPVTAVIAAFGGIILMGVAVAVAVDSGMLDKMLGRFADDNGSAHARLASLHILTLFDWKELLIGTTPDRANALQSMLGLEFGIENFWIASIVQFGIIQTTLLTIGIGCFVAEIFKRTQAGSRVIVLFLCIVAAGSVSFSSKNVSLATYIAVTILLLPRDRNRAVVGAAVRNRATLPAYAHAGRLR